MTAFLIALCVLVGAICLIDLVLTVGVIRRLREHTELIANLANNPRMPATILAAGTRVAPFVAGTVDGGTVASDALAGPTLVGVFSPTCPSCHEQLPKFLDEARRFDRDRVLAVVVGDPDQAEPQRAQLSPVARVVIEGEGGTVATALSVAAFPAFCVLDPDGTVLSSGYALDQVNLPAGV